MSDPALSSLRSILSRAGRGICSVCSSHPLVLDATCAHVRAGDGIALVESTSNQVNHRGGYTGMRPAEFVEATRRRAMAHGLSSDRLLLGGDHLGPGPWSQLPAEQAMAEAREMVEAYVRSGYRKIHIDASMPCADDAGLDEPRIAERTAELVCAAEGACDTGQSAPVYVIGSEVPSPGGATGSDALQVTPVTAVRDTIDTLERAFEGGGLHSVWDRVIAVVVQPGVEFGSEDVQIYDPGAATELSAFIRTRQDLVWEAHSTDYQPADALRRLVADGFAILKVGPWLTYALREALFALQMMEIELAGVWSIHEPSRLRETLEREMTASPEHWRRHYRGTDHEQAYQRAFSYSDRCRYYLSGPAMEGAIHRLLENLGAEALPLSLVSQYSPAEYEAMIAGEISRTPADLIQHRITGVLRKYSRACGRNE